MVVVQNDTFHTGYVLGKISYTSTGSPNCRRKKHRPPKLQEKYMHILPLWIWYPLPDIVH